MAEGTQEAKNPEPEGDSRTFNYVLVGDDSESSPQAASAGDLKSLSHNLYKAMLGAKKGWAYVYVDGKRCLVSSPIQLFLLRLPDGTTVELREDAPEFPEDGAFRCLTAAE
jgi:hypothetical protein